MCKCLWLFNWVRKHDEFADVFYNAFYREAFVFVISCRFYR